MNPVPRGQAVCWSIYASVKNVSVLIETSITVLDVESLCCFDGFMEPVVKVSEVA